MDDCPPGHSCIHVTPRDCKCLPDVPTEAAVEGGVWDLGSLPAGSTHRTEVTARNVSCRGRHRFAVAVEGAPWFRLVPPTEVVVRRGESKSVGAVVDLREVEPGELRGLLTITCETCPPPPVCVQDVEELELRVSVVLAATPGGGGEEREEPGEPIEGGTLELGPVEVGGEFPGQVGSCEGLESEEQRKLWKGAEEWLKEYQKLLEAIAASRVSSPEKPVSGTTVTGFVHPRRGARTCAIDIQAKFQADTNGRMRSDKTDSVFNGRFHSEATVTSTDPPCDVYVLGAVYAQVSDGTGKVTDHRWVNLPGGIAGGTGLACGAGAKVEFDFTVPLAAFATAVAELGKDAKVKGGASVKYFVGMQVLAKDSFPCHMWRFFAAEQIDPADPRKPLPRD